MRVGITGNIGSGKTYVCNLFSEMYNIPVFNTDNEAKIIVNTDESVIKQIKNYFGEYAYCDGKLDSMYLSNIVFKDKAKLNKLNSIVHPIVLKKFEDFHKASNAAYVIKESAIIVECKIMVDVLIGVTAPKELRLQRAIDRGGTKYDILKRMKNQMSDGAKMHCCDYVIINDGRDLIEQIKFINTCIA